MPWCGKEKEHLVSHIQVCLQLFPPNNSFLFLFVQMTKEKWEDLPKIIQLINVLDSWTHALSTFRRCFSNSLCLLYYLSCNKGIRSGYEMHGCWFYLSWTSLLASGPPCSSSQSPQRSIASHNNLAHPDGRSRKEAAHSPDKLCSLILTILLMLGSKPSLPFPPPDLPLRIAAQLEK